MSQDQRFTAWFSEQERQAIEAEAKRNHASMNYVIRTAVRSHLNLDRKPRSSVRRAVSTPQL